MLQSYQSKGFYRAILRALGRDVKQYSIHILRVHYREVTVDLWLQERNKSIKPVDM